MLNVIEKDQKYFVIIGGKEIEIVDEYENYVIAECKLDDLNGISPCSFPKKLKIRIYDQEHFGTELFLELNISAYGKRTKLEFICNEPNKYWGGYFGLDIYLQEISRQTRYFDNFRAKDLDIEDNWKSLTISCLLSPDDALDAAISYAARELVTLIITAEKVLSEKIARYYKDKLMQHTHGMAVTAIRSCLDKKIDQNQVTENI